MTQVYAVGGFIVFLIIILGMAGYWLYKKGRESEDYEQRKHAQELSNTIEKNRARIENDYEKKDHSTKPLSKLLSVFNRGGRVSKTDKSKQ